MNHSDLVENVADLHQQMLALSEQGAAQYRPIVESIIASRCRDKNQIERTLDYLLDFCAHDSGVALFRELCRYYWAIDPVGTATYVNHFREMWDSDSLPSEVSVRSHP